MKFIFKIFKLAFTLFVSFIAFAYIFSLKTNMSFENTVAYLKHAGSEMLGFNDNVNITNDENTDELILVTSNNTHYYYDQLDDNAKKIYIALENNIDNLKKDNYIIDFSTTFNALLNGSAGSYKLNKAFQSAFDAFFYDHPELFYLDLNKFSFNTKCITLGSLKTYTVEIAPKENNYLNDSFSSEQEIEIAIKKVENIRDNIVSKVSKKNTYDKIKYIHDMLVNSIEYDSTKENIHNIYGALVENKVVCEGYAKAFKYIMDGLNIECILVSGEAINSSNQRESHMWNYVKLNDNWYGVDVTWDDPIIIGGFSKNTLRHDYFLKGYNAFYNSHTPIGKISDTGIRFNLPLLSNKNYK